MPLQGLSSGSCEGDSCPKAAFRSSLGVSRAGQEVILGMQEVTRWELPRQKAWEKPGDGGGCRSESNTVTILLLTTKGN